MEVLVCFSGKFILWQEMLLGNFPLQGLIARGYPHSWLLGPLSPHLTPNISVSRCRKEWFLRYFGLRSSSSRLTWLNFWYIYIHIHIIIIIITITDFLIAFIGPLIFRTSNSPPRGRPMVAARCSSGDLVELEQWPDGPGWWGMSLVYYFMIIYYNIV